MRYSKLGPGDLEYLRGLFSDSGKSMKEVYEEIMGRYGVSERTVRRWRGYLFSGDDIKGVVEKEKLVNDGRSLGSNGLLVSYYHVGGGLDRELLMAMERYSEFLGYDIGIGIWGRYISAYSVRGVIKEEISLISDYMLDGDIVYGGVRVVFDNVLGSSVLLTLSNSSNLGIGDTIFCYPTFHMKCYRTLSDMEYIHMTSGTLSASMMKGGRSKYIEERVHKYGFGVVGDGLMRQVEFNGAYFYDLGYKVSSVGVKKVRGHIKGIVCGDVHAYDVDDVLLESLLELIREYKIEQVVLHDVFDGYSINYHEFDDLIARYKKRHVSFKEEIDKTMDVIQKFVDTGAHVIIVESNHDYFIEKWLKKKKHDDIKDLEYYMECYLMALRSNDNVFSQILEKHFGNIVTYSKRKEGYRILGWEVGMHGDYSNYTRRLSYNIAMSLNDKVIIGHSHHVSRINNFITVGSLSSTKPEYSKYPGHMMHGIALIYDDGTAQLLSIKQIQKKNFLKYW